jgi:hypothetical protein
MSDVLKVVNTKITLFWVGDAMPLGGGGGGGRGGGDGGGR